VNLAMAVLRGLRGRLHQRAYDLQKVGRTEPAQALWVLVEEIDELIIAMARRDRP